MVCWASTAWKVFKYGVFSGAYSDWMQENKDGYLFYIKFYLRKDFSTKYIFFLEICMVFIRLNFKVCISYVINCSKATLLVQAISAQNTVISPNLLLWKFCGKAHFRRVWANCQELCRNCVFPQNFHTRKLGDYFSFDLWWKSNDWFLYEMQNGAEMV